MSWQIVKDLMEKRAAAFTKATAIRTTAHTANRDLSGEEKTQHDAFLGEVETFNTRIATEQRAMALAEVIATNQADQIRMALNDENSLGMPKKDFKRYSILRAIRMKLAGTPFDGVEGEVNIELAKRMGKAAQGFYIPQDLRSHGLNRPGMARNQRSLNAATTGVGSIETTTTDTFIDILRARVLTGKVGATFLTNLQGKIAIPQKTSTAQAYWVGEGAAPTAGQPVLGQVVFTPHTLGGYTDITRQFAEQTSLDAEALVIDDLTKSLGVSLDIASFVGSGTANQPQGIVGATGVTVQAFGTNGGDPTFLNMIAMETAVANANADQGDLSYVTTPNCRGYLKGTVKASTAVAAGFVWEDNEVNGYPAYASNVLPSNGTKGTGTNLSTIIFGNFNDLVIAMWGGLDVMVDPYTGSSSGTVRVVALQDTDVELRHGASFATVTDATTVPGA